MNVTELVGTYDIDPAHSTIGFTARHAMVTKVRGTFDDIDGVATTGPDLQGAHVEVGIAVASIDTRHADRDAHLRNSDFFDADHHPRITFTSTGVQARGADGLRVTGDLTIKDVTRAITIDLDLTGAATDPYGNHRIGIEGRTSLLRSEYGITFNAALETGGVLVSDKIGLEFDLSLIKRP